MHDHRHACDATRIETAARRRLARPRGWIGIAAALALGCGPAGAQTNGTDALTAILSLNTLVGNVGRPGGVLPNPPAAVPGLPTPSAPSRLADWQGLADRMQRLRGSGHSQALLEARMDAGDTA